MGRMRYLLIKELKQFIRDPFMSRMAFLIPLVMMLVMPVVAVMDVKNVNMAVVDSDRSTLSQQLVKAIETSDYFTLRSYPPTYSEAFSQIQSGDVDIILQIPDGTEKTVVAGGNAELFIAANAVNSTKGLLGSGHLNAIISEFSERMNRTEQISSPLHVTVRNMYNGRLDFSLYMAPACLILIMIGICSFLPTLNIVTEKEKGTIEQMNVTPVTKMEFVSSKLIFFGGLGVLMFIFSFLLGKIIYGMAPFGGFGTVLLATTLFILFLSGFGLTVANFSNTLQQAVFTIFFFLMIFVLMSGLFTPVKSMVGWAHNFTYALAPRYFVDIVRSVCLKGSTIADLRFEFTMLAAFSVAMDTVAVITYRKWS